MSEELLINKICDYINKYYLLKNTRTMKWTKSDVLKEELMKYCRMTQKDIQDYFTELCEKLNAHIPCKTQKDVDTLTSLLEDMTYFPSTVKPQIYWDREVWIDSGFDDDVCMNMLIKTDKLYFEPSDDMTEHPGVSVKYKWMKENGKWEIKHTRK